jgi:hypothetical protein
MPERRDQISTKELAEFVRLRTEVSRLVRSRDDTTLPEEPGIPARQSSG